MRARVKGGEALWSLWFDGSGKRGKNKKFIYSLFVYECFGSEGALHLIFKRTSLARLMLVKTMSVTILPSFRTQTRTVT